MSLLVQAPEKQETIYPVIEATVIKRTGGHDQEFYLSSCCFHNLFSSDSEELAGMGLAILGNLMKHIDRKDISVNDKVKLNIILAKGAAPIKCPFPGMPNDKPLPLDYSKLPWDSTMFLGDAGNFKFRMERWKLLDRIHYAWVPWLIGKLKAAL